MVLKWVSFFPCLRKEKQGDSSEACIHLGKISLLCQGLFCCIWQLQNKNLSLEGTCTWVLSYIKHVLAGLWNSFLIHTYLQSRFTRTLQPHEPVRKLDVSRNIIKTSMKKSGSNINNKPSKSMQACFILLHDVEGWGSLWKGRDSRGVNGEALKKEKCSCSLWWPAGFEYIFNCLSCTWLALLDLYLVWHDIPSLHCDNKPS